MIGFRVFRVFRVFVVCRDRCAERHHPRRRLRIAPAPADAAPSASSSCRSYNKPMVYYPLSTHDAVRHPRHLVITTPHEQGRLQAAVRRRPAEIGCGFSTPRSEPRRPRAGVRHSAPSSSAATRDARARGQHLLTAPISPTTCGHAAARETGARVSANQVRDPERYGVVEFDGQGRASRSRRSRRRPSRRTRSRACTSTTTRSSTSPRT